MTYNIQRQPTPFRKDAAVCSFNSSSFKQSLNIAKAIVDFASYLHRDEYTSLGQLCNVVWQTPNSASLQVW